MRLAGLEASWGDSEQVLGGASMVALGALGDGDTAVLCPRGLREADRP